MCVIRSGMGLAPKNSMPTVRGSGGIQKAWDGSAATGAQGGTNCDLRAAAEGARKDEIGDVGTSDLEHKSNRAPSIISRAGLI